MQIWMYSERDSLTTWNKITLEKLTYRLNQSVII